MRLLLTSCCLLLSLAILGCANSSPPGSLAIEDAWARPTPPGATAGAVYATITNHGETAVKLIDAGSEHARVLEFHESFSDAGIMKMRRQEFIEVPAGQSVELAPGGLHLMLIDLSTPLEEGSTLEVRLDFDTGESKQVIATIESR